MRANVNITPVLPSAGPSWGGGGSQPTSTYSTSNLPRCFLSAVSAPTDLSSVSCSIYSVFLMLQCIVGHVAMHCGIGTPLVDRQSENITFVILLYGGR